MAARVPFIIFALNNGEVSPRLEGRQDFQKYKSSVKEAVNFTPLTLGGMKRRAGFRFNNPAKNSGAANDNVRLQRFVFSTEQSYVIEFGHQYARFYRAGDRVEDPPGTPVEVETPYINGDLMSLTPFQSADVLYICDNSGGDRGLYRTRKLIRTASDEFELRTVHFDPPATVGHEPTGAELHAGDPGEPPPPPPGE